MLLKLASTAFPEAEPAIAASMYDTARAIVLSSLPPGLSRRERRLAFARRLYEGELPEAALVAYAEWDEAASASSVASADAP